MENKPTEDAAEDELPLTWQELKRLQNFIQRGTMDMSFKGEYAVLEVALEVPQLPDVVTVEEVGKISLRSMLAATILNVEREEEIYTESARDKLLALAGRLRELVRIVEQEAEKLHLAEWEPDVATRLAPMNEEAPEEEEFPRGVDLGMEEEDKEEPFDGMLREST